MKTRHSEMNVFQEISNEKRPIWFIYCEDETASRSRRARTKWMRFSLRRRAIWQFET